MPVVNILFDVCCATYNDFTFQQMDKHVLLNMSFPVLFLTICSSLQGLILEV